MKRYLFLIALLIAWSGRVVAQSVTVDATIDSLQILIGEQAKIKLQVSLDADKRAIFPVYTDTLVNGVEIIDVAKPDTQLLNDGRRAFDNSRVYSYLFRLGSLLSAAYGSDSG